MLEKMSNIGSLGQIGCIAAIVHRESALAAFLLQPVVQWL